MAALAVIDRAVFYPPIFTRWQPIEVNPANEASRYPQQLTPQQLVRNAELGREKSSLARRFPNDMGALLPGSEDLVERPDWRNWPETFDFVLSIDFGTAPNLHLKELEQVWLGSFFEIYRIVRP
jgi:hypothetical protein